MKKLWDKYRKMEAQENSLSYQQHELHENNRTSSQVVSFFMGLILSLLFTGNYKGSICVGGIFWCINRLNSIDIEKKIAKIKANSNNSDS